MNKVNSCQTISHKGSELGELWGIFGPFLCSQPLGKWISIGKPVSTITQQMILVIWGRIFAIEPSLVPILRMTVMLGVREADVFPFLN